MLKSALITSLVLVFAASPAALKAQSPHGFSVGTSRLLGTALPNDFYLEGTAIPTEKRNAALVMTPSDKQVVFALLDTSGYSSHVQQKYAGMMITEGEITVCGRQIQVGSYGFGLKQPFPPGNAPGHFTLYNQAGSEVASCEARNDPKLRMPRPLQVVPAGRAGVRLYLGRLWIEVR